MRHAFNLGATLRTKTYFDAEMSFDRRILCGLLVGSPVRINLDGF